jgi:competence protein ComFB
MAKKSNKTEHVLKLITKNDDADQDDLFGLQQEFAGNSSSAPASKPDEPLKAEKPKRGKGVKTEEPTSVGALQEKAEIPKKPAETVEAVREATEKAEVRKETASAEASIKETEDTAAVTQNAAPKTASASGAIEADNGASAILCERGHLINLAEVLVKEKVALVMEKMKVCTCRTCVNDILALTLNTLPAKYVTTDTGKQYLQLDTYKKQYETDILAALTKACVRVKASPRHVKE